jgi:DNA-binding LacI/PurR family transcriptional regulator
MELPEPPTAILAASIDLALGVMDYANDVGVAIGDRLSLVSFDDAEIFRQWKPAITSIAQPTAKIGVEIAELVLSHIGGRHGDRYRDIRLECTIQLRDSVCRI